jgi:uncharacterized protein (TIGR02246 family)|tara:strand:- start:627 stop:1013 length:387 start_codon:yes stop_codon:yes gene_type:complete
MTDPMEIIETLCQRYQAAVSANDSAAYGRLFAADAIRVPPGGEPEHGPEAIAESEQNDYDVARWSVRSRPLDAMLIDEGWVYGVAEADITLVEHAGGATKSLKANKTWLVQKQPSGAWLIKRQMWNYR